MLHEAGCERVYIAMHIYKEGYEPEVGNERFAPTPCCGAATTRGW